MSDTPGRHWTKRQREVLDLLAAGRTNAEIATALGITFDGAKYHVSEVMSHLGVETREDAAEYWRLERGMPSRWARLRRAILSGTIGKVAIGAGTLAFAGIAAVILLNLPGDDDSESSNEPTPLTRGENYTYTPALAYLKPDGTVAIVEGDGAVRDAAYLTGCDPYSHSAVPGVVVSGIKWSMNGDRAFCIAAEGPTIRTQWPPDNPAIVDLFPPGECQVGEPAHVFFPTIGFDGARFSCFRGTRGPYAIRDATAVHGTVEGGVNSNDWSPAGHHVIAQFDIRPSGSTAGFKWSIFDTSGVLRLTITEAGDRAARLVWSLDGTRAVYSNQEGLQILDTKTWTNRTLDASVPGAGRLHWILDDSAILVQDNPYRIVDVDDGSSVPVPGSPPALLEPAPNGHLAARVVPGSAPDRLAVGIIDLRTGALTSLPGTESDLAGVSFVWSGDSKRICWSHANDSRNGQVVDCASADGSGPVTRVAATFNPSATGVGGTSHWQMFSPDLSRVAYAVPGLDDPAAPQELWTSDLDGGNAVHIGPVDGPLGFEWQPDAVYRPPAPFP